jgi:hypothetical protein
MKSQITSWILVRDGQHLLFRADEFQIGKFWPALSHEEDCSSLLRTMPRCPSMNVSLIPTFRRLQGCNRKGCRSRPSTHHARLPGCRGSCIKHQVDASITNSVLLLRETEIRCGAEEADDGSEELPLWPAGGATEGGQRHRWLAACRRTAALQTSEAHPDIYQRKVQAQL